MNENFIEFAGLYIKGIVLENLFKNKNFEYITTLNAEFFSLANKDNLFKHIINNSVATLDGQIPFYFAKKQNPFTKIEKLSGSQIIYDFCEYAKLNNKKVFLLGGLDMSNKISVKKLSYDYNIQVFGYSPPFATFPFCPTINNEIQTRIASTRPDIIFVGFGAPKQEYWIYENLEFLASIGLWRAIGVGGTFEFISGKFKRAPKFLQNLGLEGIYRFYKEPSYKRLRRLFISLLALRFFIK